MGNESDVVNKRGTYCVVIQQQLLVASCPLPMGTCFWKHRKTGLCTYTIDRTDMSVPELAALVGLDKPTDAQCQEMKADLYKALSKELKQI